MLYIVTCARDIGPLRTDLLKIAMKQLKHIYVSLPMIIYTGCMSPILLSYSMLQHRCSEQHRASITAGELYCDRGQPADIVDREYRTDRLRLAVFSEAARGHRLRAPVPRLRSQDPRPAVSKPGSPPWADVVLQLCSGCVRDARLGRHRLEKFDTDCTRWGADRKELATVLHRHHRLDGVDYRSEG